MKFRLKNEEEIFSICSFMKYRGEIQSVSTITCIVGSGHEFHIE